ncbi:hypothetical protein [Micromonospora sp. M61]|uniref:hypothetical protein n=1 Tax=Micromonospora sp. M61 TaxID=2824890 RepID=UPI001B3911AC|nr:hypothetical protein [Micromonospora sp. M61]MBQ0982239.1 hypothetical protein [Micromonospora sp. M61]
MNLDRKTWQLITTAGLFLLAALLCVAAWAVANAPQSGPDRPKVTDWMQAWGSIAGVFAGLAAAGAATALLLFERRQARQARDELAAERSSEDERRAQLVFTSQPGIAGVTGWIRGVRVRVYNHRLSPIHRVTGSVNFQGRVVQLEVKDFILPAEYAEINGTAQPPISTADARISSQESIVTVEFTDSSGQRWRRVGNGHPRRVPRYVFPRSSQSIEPESVPPAE